MTSTAEAQVLDLLAVRATEGLDEADERELDLRLAACPGLSRDHFEPAAAAIDLAVSPPPEPMPLTLRRRIEAEAARFVAAAEPEIGAAPREGAEVRPLGRIPLAAPAPRAKAAQPPPQRSSWPLWALAAAASLLAVAGWWPRLAGSAGSAPPPRAVAQAPAPVAPPPPTAAERRVELLAASGTIAQAWTATEDALATAATGDVVWSPDRQTGFMRFRGLPANDPAEHQYQLWIFDAERDDRFPVDGGVFDIPPGEDEVLVPIRPKLGVDRAVLFAVTLEPPGGVVVSSRERLVLLAQTG